MLICYTQKKFAAEALELIDTANEIIQEYQQAGYDLTLRQLYYQFVSRNVIPNNERSYKRLGTIISDARRAGLIDWSAIVDRTRSLRRPPAWDSVSSIIRSCAQQYDVDWWEDQKYRIEVWVEKDALLGVIETACEPYHVPYFSCRGYVSDSEIWSAGQRVLEHARNKQATLIIHLGDHDPSGIDMSRDIEKRIKLFAGDASYGVVVSRIALTMDQVDENNLPPNPAKLSDMRAKSYIEQYGESSWELDALNPPYITRLIRERIEPLISERKWNATKKRRDEGRKQLEGIADSLE